MIFFKKSQTATEYLVILAVVVVIALIVVGVMGGIPSIGGGASESTARAQLRVMDVGIQNYMVNSKYTLLKVSNNQASTITITDMTVNGKGCSFRDTRLRAGETKDIGCYGVKSYDDGTKFQYPITITYTESDTGATYTINDSNVPLVGTIAGGSELHTGQQTCSDLDNYGNNPLGTCDSSHLGQDGYVDGTAKSFGQITDGTIQDLHTGLYWSNASASTGAKATAQTYCDGLNSAEQGGFSDWRVPNIVELITVLGSSTDMGGTSNPSPNGDFWFDGNSGNIWSSTENLDSNRFLVTLISDSFTPYTQGTFNLRYDINSYSVCVRGETSGISLVDSNKDFINNGDGTVTDIYSGIVWQDGESIGMFWNDSVAYCNNLALCENGSFDGSSIVEGACVGSSIKFNDWRLPTHSELFQLADYSNSGLNAPDYFPDAFESTGSGYYWSGTSTPSDTLYMNAYELISSSGYGKDETSAYARCVRNGFIE